VSETGEGYGEMQELKLFCRAATTSLTVCRLVVHCVVVLCRYGNLDAAVLSYGPCQVSHKPLSGSTGW